MKKILAHVRAYWYGIQDGWKQPYELTSSTNVQHLTGGEYDDDVQNTLDRGINHGQFLRSPRHHQRLDEV